MSAVGFVIRALLVLPIGLLIRPADSKFCTLSHRTDKTQWVSYRVSYWNSRENGIRYREAYREQTTQHWEKLDVCCEGYEPKTDSDSKCYPVCPSGCPNGVCQAPNGCACNAGYEVSKNANNVSTCIPICWSGCRNGVCIAPDRCLCEPGYDLHPNSDICESACRSIGNGGPDGCGVYAACVGPNSCMCASGYVAIDSRSSTTPGTGFGINQTTSDVFGPVRTSLATMEQRFDSSFYVCRPICRPECGANAHCRFPNECQCDESSGYVMDSASNQCVPICRNKTCVNGVCDISGNCVCLEGYKPHPALSDVCDPHCPHGCVNGNCTKPDFCECHQDYRRLSELSLMTPGAADNVCVTSCAVDCQGGYCLDPNLCHCHPGYALIVGRGNATSGKEDGKVGDEARCVPICQPACSAGSRCIAPHVCEPVRTDGECGRGGRFANGSCVCGFGWTGSRCDELSFCSVVFPGFRDGVQSPIVVPKRLVFPSINESMELSDRNESNAALDWGGPRCDDECRVSLTSSKEAEGGRKVTMDCYELKVLRPTAGLLIRKPGNWSIEKSRSENTTICFVDAASSCNQRQFQSRGGVIAGSLIAVVLIAAASAVGTFWFIRRRRNKIVDRRVYERDATIGESTMRIIEEGIDD